MKKITSDRGSIETSRVNVSSLKEKIEKEIKNEARGSSNARKQRERYRNVGRFELRRVKNFRYSSKRVEKFSPGRQSELDASSHENIVSFMKDLASPENFSLLAGRVSVGQRNSRGIAFWEPGLLGKYLSPGRAIRIGFRASLELSKTSRTWKSPSRNLETFQRWMVSGRVGVT